MDENQLIEFIKWIPTKIKELQNKTPEEIVTVLNSLSKTPKGQQQLETLISAFKSENAAIQPDKDTNSFKKGGKLDYLINRFKDGGKPKVVSTLDYAPGYTSRPVGMDKFDFTKVFSDGYRAIQWSSKNGAIKQLLQVPNTIGGTMREISPNKQDTIYTNTFNGARVSNKKLPWYTPKKEKDEKKQRYNYFNSRFSEYYESGGKINPFKLKE